MTVLLAVTTAHRLDPGELTDAEAAQLATLGGAARQRQWLTSRHALRLLLGLTGLPRETTAYRFPHRQVSLAHTESSAAAVALAGPVPSALIGVGVDVEPDGDPDPRAARFFLDERERAWLAGVPAAERAGQQTSLWTAKEALFKADAGNRHAMLRDYALTDPGAPAGRAVKRGALAAVFGYARMRLRDSGTHLCVAAAFRPGNATARADGAPMVSTTRRGMATQTVTFDEVADRISATLSIPASRLTPETTLADLAADSFLLVEMVVDLQEEFDTLFTQLQLREVDNLGELVDLLRRSQIGTEAATAQ